MKPDGALQLRSGFGLNELLGVTCIARKLLIEISPLACTIEAANTCGCNNTGIEVPDIDAELTTWFLSHRLPVRDTSTMTAPECLDRLWTPNVLARVFRVTDDAHCSDLVERPERAIATAN
jgi:hypothetical protein